MTELARESQLCLSRSEIAMLRSLASAALFIQKQADKSVVITASCQATKISCQTRSATCKLVHQNILLITATWDPLVNRPATISLQAAQVELLRISLRLAKALALCEEQSGTGLWADYNTLLERIEYFVSGRQNGEDDESHEAVEDAEEKDLSVNALDSHLPALHIENPGSTNEEDGAPDDCRSRVLDSAAASPLRPPPPLPQSQVPNQTTRTVTRDTNFSRPFNSKQPEPESRARRSSPREDVPSLQISAAQNRLSIIPEQADQEFVPPPSPLPPSPPSSFTEDHASSDNLSRPLLQKLKASSPFGKGGPKAERKEKVKKYKPANLESLKNAGFL